MLLEDMKRQAEAATGIVQPAGTGHQRIDASRDLPVVGADPVYGADGALKRLWR